MNTTLVNNSKWNSRTKEKERTNRPRADGVCAEVFEVQNNPSKKHLLNLKPSVLHRENDVPLLDEVDQVVHTEREKDQRTEEAVIEKERLEILDG